AAPPVARNVGSDDRGAPRAGRWSRLSGGTRGEEDLAPWSPRGRRRLLPGGDGGASLQTTDHTVGGAARARAVCRGAVRSGGGPALPQHLDRPPLVDRRTGLVDGRHAGVGMAPAFR